MAKLKLLGVEIDIPKTPIKLVEAQEQLRAEMESLVEERNQELAAIAEELTSGTDSEVRSTKP